MEPDVMQVPDLSPEVKNAMVVAAVNDLQRQAFALDLTIEANGGDWSDDQWTEMREKKESLNQSIARLVAKYPDAFPVS